jgi:hypothetical protein
MRTCRGHYLPGCEDVFLTEWHRMGLGLQGHRSHRCKLTGMEHQDRAPHLLTAAAASFSCCSAALRFCSAMASCFAFCSSLALKADDMLATCCTAYVAAWLYLQN